MRDEIRHYLVVGKRRWPLSVLAFALVLAGGITAAVMLPAVYRSSAVILVESQQIPDELVRSTVTSLPSERIQVIKQRVMTRNNILQIIQKFDLYKDQRKRLSNSGLVDLVRSNSGIDLLSFDNAGRQRGDKFTIAFTIWFEHSSSGVAAQVANELVTLILDENVRARTTRASETAKFLKREVDRRREELKLIEENIAAYKQENRDALPDNLVVRISLLDRVQDQLSKVEEQLRALDEERKLYILGYTTNGTGAGQRVGAAPSAISRRHEELKAELVKKSATYSANHPEIKWLNREIASVKSEIDSAASAIGDSISASAEQGDQADGSIANDLDKPADRPELAIFTHREQVLLAAKNRLDNRVQSITESIAQTPQVELGLRGLMRNYESARAQHQNLANKLANAELGETLEEDKQAERFEVIEQPTAARDPIKPNREKIAAFGFLLAVAAAGGSVVVLETLDGSVRGTAHLQSAMHRRPIVAIPYLRTRRDRRRTRNRVMLFIMALMICGLIGIVAVHFLYMPLDLLFLKIQTRIPF